MNLSEFSAVAERRAHWRALEGTEAEWWRQGWRGRGRGWPAPDHGDSPVATHAELVAAIIVFICRPPPVADIDLRWPQGTATPSPRPARPMTTPSVQLPARPCRRQPTPNFDRRSSARVALAVPLAIALTIAALRTGIRRDGRHAPAGPRSAVPIQSPRFRVTVGHRRGRMANAVGRLVGRGRTVRERRVADGIENRHPVGAAGMSQRWRLC